MKYGIALLLSLTLVGIVTAAAIRLSDGVLLEGEIVREEGDKVLVHTQPSDGNKDGLAWLDKDFLSKEQSSPVVDLDSELKKVEHEYSRGNWEKAREGLVPLVRQFPSSHEARVLLARAMRRLYQFTPSYFLFQSVIDDYKKEKKDIPAELAKECAESAVLMADKRKAAAAIRELKRSEFPNREVRYAMRDYADALQLQLNGGRRIVWAGEIPKKYDRDVLKKQRSSFNKKDADTYLSQQLSNTIKKYFNETDEGTAAKTRNFCTRVIVKTDATEEMRLSYASGGSEVSLRSLTTSCVASVVVDETQWLSLWDWQKRIELYGALSRMGQIFPNAECRVSVFYRVGKTEEYPHLATCDQKPAGRPQLKLKTTPRVDFERRRQLKKEQEDYEKNRKR